MDSSAKLFANAVGHEGTHVSDFNLMVGGASILSPFSQEYRGYTTSSLVFQALFTPPVSTSPGSVLGGTVVNALTTRGIQIWNTSWAAADAAKLRDSAITNVVKGLNGEHPETTPHDPWK
jgi:hypothetical protein